MKKFARVICVLLSGVLGLSLLACPSNDNISVAANDSVPLVFSVQETDNVFNPFFGTSGYDNEITGNTQIGMLSSNSAGDVACGEDEPTVVLDYNQTIYYNGESFSPQNAPSNVPESTLATDYYTEYEFLIKNHIKFSDGVDLTIKDVLFNLYTYLDPTYYGSSTIYSTAIDGMAEYRENDPEAGSDGGNNSFERTAQNNASTRITNMRWAYSEATNERDTFRTSVVDADSDSARALKAQLLKDVETARFTFYDEVSSDWKSAESALEDFDEDYDFEEAWEIFLLNEGLITVGYKANGDIDTYKDANVASSAKDKAGNPRKVGDKMIDYGDYGAFWHDSASMINIVFNTYMGIGDIDASAYVQSSGRKPTTDIITDDQGKATGSSLKNQNQQTYENELYNASSLKNNLYRIITYWATAATVRDTFVSEEKSKLLSSDEQRFYSIDGITVEQLKKNDSFQGVNGSHTIEDDIQYVLKIKIDKVDPKAIWNFAFNVSPMHYYSNGANLAKQGLTGDDEYKKLISKYVGKTVGGYDDYRAFDYHAFNYPGVEGYDATKLTFVGIPYGNKFYMDKVLKAPAVISVPVGAGMYQVANQDVKDEWFLFDTNGDTHTLKSNADDLRPKFTDFSKNNIIYYIRNPYFYTVTGKGLENGDPNNPINNCKIKMIRYKIITADKLLESIFNHEVHYGDPSATNDNLERINSRQDISNIKIDNNGYGYIGINATYIPDIQVRRIIMHTIKLDLIKSFYSQDLASLIYRPISSVSWASPQNDANKFSAKKAGNKYNDLRKQYYEYKTAWEDESNTEIEQMMTSLGYTRSGSGPWTRIADGGRKLECKYTFTIAGKAEDHPAYNALEESAKILNKHGFDITVKSDSQALSKLASGLLTVWAAAWGSTIDPDMYQVYHIDSTATSVRNWGYPDIIANTNNLYQLSEADKSKFDPLTGKDQYTLVEELSDLIDKGRESLDREQRMDAYKDALNKVMELAVELPTYQRVNLYVFCNDVIDQRTFNTDLSPYSGPLTRLWEVSLVAGAK